MGRDETNNKEAQSVTTLSLHQKAVLKSKKVSSFRRSIRPEVVGAAPTTSSKRLIEVVDEIIGMFEPHRKAQQIFGSARAGAFHRSPVFD